MRDPATAQIMAGQRVHLALGDAYDELVLGTGSPSPGTSSATRRWRRTSILLANRCITSYTYNSQSKGTAMRVSTAEFIKRYSVLADRALAEPVTITKHGRDRLVVVSAAEYERLKKRDRQVFQSDGLPDRVLELIAQAEVPAEYAPLDSELEDTAP